VYINATGQRLCLITALLGYLTVRSNRLGPQFIFQDGSSLSRWKLVSSHHQVLFKFGIDVAHYGGGQSFRIRAATIAARLGVSDSLIKKMGRWKSSVFTYYITTP